MKPVTVLASMSLMLVMAGAWILTNNLPAPKPDVGPRKNITFLVQGRSETLVQDNAENFAATALTSDASIHYFGNQVKADLNQDEIPDTAFVITQGGVGTSTRYYVVAALQGSTGDYVGTNGVYIGSGIQMKGLSVSDEKLVVTYVDQASVPETAESSSLEINVVVKVFGTKLVLLDDEE